MHVLGSISAHAAQVDHIAVQVQLHCTALALLLDKGQQMCKPVHSTSTSARLEGQQL